MLKIRDRLNCISADDQGWRRKLRDIETQMGKYESARKQNPGSNYETILHKILPTYWEVFHTHNAYEKKQEYLPNLNYDIGIFLVGFSSLPIVLSLAEIQPTEKIYFLYSSDTKKKCYEITDRMQAMLTGKTCFDNLIGRVEDIVLDIQSCKNSRGCGLEIDDPSDPVKTFKLIKTVIDKVGDKRIALDLTGGKKTMIGGGFTAGSIWASKWSEAAQEFTDFCDMFYIDSLKYDADRSAPVPGHEFLSRLKNPYDVYNVQNVQQAEKLFEKHNYEAAAELWEKVRAKLQEPTTKRYGLVKETEETKNRYRIAHCYYLWDAFYYDKANNAKKRHKNSWGYNEKHVKDSIDVVDILSKVTNKRTLFENKVRIIHYAADRYQNAIRRKESGKLEDAIVRFAQVIEMLCNYRVYQLAQDGCLVNSSGNSKCVAPDRIWDFKPLIRLLFGKQAIDLDGGTYWISKSKRLESKDYGCDSIKSIIDLIQVRHDFVHFNSLMKQKQMENHAENLQKFAKTFLKNFHDKYYPINDLTFDELLKLHKFRW